VAAEIKKVKPQLPVVMIAKDVELPVDALKSVDALVWPSPMARASCWRLFVTYWM
jgi:hypothetical protein